MTDDNVVVGRGQVGLGLVPASQIAQLLRAPLVQLVSQALSFGPFRGPPLDVPTCFRRVSRETTSPRPGLLWAGG